MIIDFHTHIFPDKIACETINKLTREAKYPVQAFTDGSQQGILQSMKEAGVDLSVVLPVVTRPGQFSSILNFAIEVSQSEGLLSFGGVHPDSNNVVEELKEIKRSGLKGIKLHPDYQHTMIDDRNYVNLIDSALNLDLIVLIHSGVDVGYPDPVHCTPKKSLNLLRELKIDRSKQTKIILAHMGGYQCWDDVEEYLVGQNIFFDLSYTMGRLAEQQLVRIINNHGADRILFGTDSPWSDQKETIELFGKLPLSKEEQERILGGNAIELLNLQNA